MEVEITPYANHEYTLTGKIIEVNPRIDENGMVKVKAITDNHQGLLIDGMNVSILIKRQIDHKIIIPKSAVLPRQGKKDTVIYENNLGLSHMNTVIIEN